MKEKVRVIIKGAMPFGWVMEPEAKSIMSLYNMTVPVNQLVLTEKAAVDFARVVGYPLVCKIVSPGIMHKSDVKGVVLNILDDHKLQSEFRRLSLLPGFKGMLVEKMVIGQELIVGAKNDYQFGPVVLLGIGGTTTEIYQDTVIRMAPLSSEDCQAMIRGLKGHLLLDGYRGAEPVNKSKLTNLLLHFSTLVMDIEEYFDSIDLNPVLCSADNCFIADARILLKQHG